MSTQPIEPIDPPRIGAMVIGQTPRPDLVESVKHRLPNWNLLSHRLRPPCPHTKDPIRFLVEKQIRFSTDTPKREVKSIVADPIIVAKVHCV